MSPISNHNSNPKLSLFYPKKKIYEDAKVGARVFGVAGLLSGLIVSIDDKPDRQICKSCRRKELLTFLVYFPLSMCVFGGVFFASASAIKNASGNWKRRFPGR
jgi:hypothetical protein